MSELLVFYGLSALVALCSLFVITMRNPVTAAVFLVLDMFLLAGVYAFLGAEFIAAIQVLVYAGAIVVLFMFVIMLLNLDFDSLHDKTPRGAWDAAVFLLVLLGLGAFALAGGVTHTLSDALAQHVPSVSYKQLDQDNTFGIGVALFTEYLWPFELASILILLAVIASVIISKKRKGAQALGNATKGAERSAKGEKVGTY